MSTEPTDSLSQRIHALIFNGITKASSTGEHWLPLNERERIARRVYDELRAGDIEFRLGGLALPADAIADRPGPCTSVIRTVAGDSNIWCELRHGHLGDHESGPTRWKERSPAAEHRARPVGENTQEA